MRRGGLAIVVVLACGLVVSATGGAQPIAGATYNGKSTGDGHGRKVQLNVSADGKLIGDLTVGFDSQCVQGHNHYQNKRVSLTFYQVRIKPDGSFQDRKRKRYRGGREVYKTAGQFSDNGKRVRGRFSDRSSFSPPSIQAVHCHSRGQFTAQSTHQP